MNRQEVSLNIRKLPLFLLLVHCRNDRNIITLGTKYRTTHSKTPYRRENSIRDLGGRIEEELC